LEFGFVEGVDEEAGLGEECGDFGMVGEVIPMAVGEEELGDVVVILGGDGEERIGGVLGRVDNGGGEVLLIDEEVGVGFGKAAGVQVDFHGGNIA